MKRLATVTITLDQSDDTTQGVSQNGRYLLDLIIESLEAQLGIVLPERHGFKVTVIKEGL